MDKTILSRNNLLSGLLSFLQRSKGTRINTILLGKDNIFYVKATIISNREMQESENSWMLKYEIIQGWTDY